MKNRIIEIVELGQFQSLIQRENDPITELIKTDSLIEELNEQLRKHNAVGQSELLPPCSKCGRKWSGSLVINCPLKDCTGYRR